MLFFSFNFFIEVGKHVLLVYILESHSFIRLIMKYWMHFLNIYLHHKIRNQTNLGKILLNCAIYSSKY